MSNISLEEARLLRNILGMSHKDAARQTGLTDIEDLALLVGDRARFQQLTGSFPVTMKKVKRVLSLPLKRNTPQSYKSPILEAARTNAIQVFRTIQCPATPLLMVIL